MMQYQVSKEMVLRSIAGECIVIPTGSLALRLNGMIALSSSAQRLMPLLQAGCTEAALVACLLDHFEVEEATASRDVAEFLAQLRSLDLLQEVEV